MNVSELIGNEQSSYLHLSIARHRSARWLLVKVSPMAKKEKEKRRKKRDWRSALARSPKREEDETVAGRRNGGGRKSAWVVFVGRAEFGEWHHKSLEFQRCIARVARGPGDASLSPWGPRLGAQHAACYARVLRDRFRFCLRACVVTSSPDRELAAPMFQFPSAAFNAQVACRACWYFSFCLHYFGPSRYAAHGGPSLSVFTFSSLSGLETQPTMYNLILSLSLSFSGLRFWNSE